MTELRNAPWWHQPKRRVKDLTGAERQQRHDELALLVTAESVRARLRPLLDQEAYRSASGHVAWSSLAAAAFPEVQPPLEAWELFHYLRPYMPGGNAPPRRYIWWALWVYREVADPDEWLRQQQGGVGSGTDLAEQVGHGVTPEVLSAYISRHIAAPDE